GDRLFGIVHERQRVDLRAIGARIHRQRTDRIGAARGDVRGGEVVARVEAIGQREPGTCRIDVVVFPLQQDLPLEGTFSLGVAINRLYAGPAGDRAHAAHVLIPTRGR